MSGTAAQSRRWRQRYPEKTLVYDAKRRARRKGIPFNLTAADVKALLDQGWVCTYCETPLGSYAGGTQPLSVTLDRLVPVEGYTPENVVLACHRCNCEKSEHTVESLRAWADRIETIIERRNG